MAHRISIFLSIFMTVHGDTIRLTATSTKQSYIFYAAPTDRIIITAAKTEQLVRLGIKSTYNLSDEDCATSAVNVTSGEAGLYVGSYCGKQTPDWFYASHNTATIVFRSPRVAAGLGRINVTYHIQSAYICGGAMSAYHRPRFIRSPQYPLRGTPFRVQSCIWAIAGLNNERVSITVKSATFSTIDCSTFNVTIFDGEITSDTRTLGTWCGGAGKTFFSYWRFLYIIAAGQRHLPAGFEIEYTAIPDPQRPIVNISLEQKATPEVIMSPGPLKIYSEFEELRWLGHSQQRVVVNITVLNASMEHTQDCDTDSIRIHLDSNPAQAAIGLGWCGGDLPSYEVFTSRLMVVFRAYPSTETHKGFSLQYSILDTPTCGGNLTATESVQHLMTPNYPGPYQGHQKCQWLIRTTDPMKMVKLTFTTTVLISNCISESVRMYDGTNEQAREIGYRCRYNRQNDNTYRSESRFMLIVFTSIIDNKDRSGFKASYVEESCGYALDAVRGKRIVLNSPGYPGNYSSGGNCTWTIAGKAVALRFIDMNIPCSGDSITFSDRGSTELKRKWEICGNKAHNYITIGNSMSINFVTTTGRGAGFKLTYERLTSMYGCAGDVRQVAVTSHKSTIRSVGYPTGYFDDLHCRWHFKTRYGGIEINFTIADINTDGSTCTDAIRVYDGSNTTARLLMERCSPGNFSLKSTGRSLYVEFVTDSVNVGSGFVMRCSSFKVQKTSQTDYKTTFIAVGGIIGPVIIVIACFVVCSSKRRRCNSRRTVFQSQGMHTPAPSAATGTAVDLQVYPFPPSFSNPSPPSYSEIGPLEA
ncbi:cubilin-like isoform X1 [Haliotis rufescens]|uniref:cubilin-like isoform X1 n=1 Tax=Haliotis rufescens TaxID=6454 RepID=UPI00201ED3D1|nr:cubilin-like isoform X1 [Haliotis rufescens]